MTKKAPKPGVVVTYKYKVYGNREDFTALDRMAKSVNIVWNYCCNLSTYCWKNKRPPKAYRTLQKGKIVWEDYPQSELNEQELVYTNEYTRSFSPGVKQSAIIKNGYISSNDLEKMTAGSSEDLDLPANTIVAVCQEFDKSRKTKATLIKKGLLKRKRKKGAKPKQHFIGCRGKKSRPWIPAKGASLRFDHSTNILSFNKIYFKINIDRPLDGDICEAKFVKEPDGWFICIAIRQAEYATITRINTGGVIGVDLGLKTFATLSNGTKLDLDPEPVKKIWGKTGTYSELIRRFQSKRDRLKNRRSDHKASKKELLLTSIITKLEKSAARWREHQHYNLAHKILDSGSIIVVGDLSGKFIQSKSGKKSKMLSHGYFKARLEWLGRKRGQVVSIMSERDTTITCSSCGEKSGPTGTEGLSVRSWTCSKCGAEHDRDVNAAKNIAHLYDSKIAISAAAAGT